MVGGQDSTCKVHSGSPMHQGSPAVRLFFSRVCVYECVGWWWILRWSNFRTPFWCIHVFIQIYTYTKNNYIHIYPRNRACSMVFGQQLLLLPLLLHLLLLLLLMFLWAFWEHLVAFGSIWEHLGRTLSPATKAHMYGMCVCEYASKALKWAFGRMR